MGDFLAATYKFWWVVVLIGALLLSLSAYRNSTRANDAQTNETTARITVDNTTFAQLAAQQAQITALGQRPVGPPAGFAFTAAGKSYWCTLDSPGVTTYVCTQTGSK